LLITHAGRQKMCCSGQSSPTQARLLFQAADETIIFVLATNGHVEAKGVSQTACSCTSI